jgi:type IV pilus assembly protein PilE
MNNRHALEHHAAMRRAAGFTLIELMITVAIIAILVAVAMPSYEGYLRKSRRADAQSFAQEVVARQQHFMLDRRAFADSITNAPAAGGLGMTVPANVSEFYAVTMVVDNAAAPPTLTITATPSGKQAYDPCGALSIDQRGVKAAAGTGKCW